MKIPHARVPFAIVAALFWANVAGGETLAHDPDALAKIVDTKCLPRAREGLPPDPCAAIDLSAEGGYAVLKDRVGIGQFLLIPIAPLRGMEDPGLLAPDGPNFWRAAWQARGFLVSRLGRPVERERIGLAVNSARGRTQNRLHIHLDCLRAEIAVALKRLESQIGAEWSPGPVLTWNGHPYRALRFVAETPAENDPFRMLAAGIPGARNEMGNWTLVLAGARFADGKDGFFLLAGRATRSFDPMDPNSESANPQNANPASGEELLDHACAG